MGWDLIGTKPNAHTVCGIKYQLLAFQMAGVILGNAIGDTLFYCIYCQGLNSDIVNTGISIIQVIEHIGHGIRYGEKCITMMPSSG